MRQDQIIATPFANRSFQPRTKAAARKHNLEPLTRPNRAKISQPRKINVRPLPEATQWKWLANLRKAKEVAGTTNSLAPTCSQPMNTPSMLSPTSPVPPIKFTEHTKYCAICALLGKIYLKEFPISLNWDNNDEEEGGKDQDKGEDQSDSEKKTPQTSPWSFVTTTLTPQAPILHQEISSVTPENEDHRCNTLVTLLGHENQDTLEDPHYIN